MKWVSVHSCSAKPWRQRDEIISVLSRGKTELLFVHGQIQASFLCKSCRSVPVSLAVASSSTFHPHSDWRRGTWSSSDCGGRCFFLTQVWPIMEKTEWERGRGVNAAGLETLKRRNRKRRDWKRRAGRPQERKWHFSTVVSDFLPPSLNLLACSVRHWAPPCPPPAAPLGFPPPPSLRSSFQSLFSSIHLCSG